MTKPASRAPLVLRATVDRWLADSGAFSALPAAPQVEEDPSRWIAHLSTLLSIPARLIGARRSMTTPTRTIYGACPQVCARHPSERPVG